MAELSEKQFELKGVVFGWGCPVDVHQGGWNPGGKNTRNRDVEHPTRDGMRPGKDLAGPQTHAFSLFANQENEHDAWATVEALQYAWDADEERKKAGEVLPLRYCIAGQTRRVYGRPRRWTPSSTETGVTGRIDIEADFVTVDQIVYEDELQFETFPIAIPTDTTAGVVAPLVPPFSSAAGSSTTIYSITVGGTRPTPVWITFKSPYGLAGASVRVTERSKPVGAPADYRLTDWTAALRDPLGVSDEVTIDARPWITAATRSDGSGVRVSPRVTRIHELWLPPGGHSVAFTGNDPTGTATATVSWRNARRSPR